MKAETYLFAGVSVFFAVLAVVYAWGSLEPAGTAALTVAALMAALISFFCGVQHVRRGQRLQDRTDADIHEGAGPLEFFPPHSYAPVLTALGAALLGTGIVYGVWLVLIGLGVMAPGIAGFVFQYADRTA